MAMDEIDAAQQLRIEQMEKELEAIKSGGQVEIPLTYSQKLHNVIDSRIIQLENSKDVNIANLKCLLN